MVRPGKQYGVFTTYDLLRPDSGGNLAAVLAHKAAQSEPPIPLVLQLLLVPVTDNTATTSGVPYKSWAENENTVQLTPGRMLWFRDNYLPNEKDRTAWESSPIFAPDEWFKKLPKAWVAVMELDVLRDEGIEYAKKMQAAGVEAEIKLYEGAPHPIMAMDGKWTMYPPYCSWLTPGVIACSQGKHPSHQARVTTTDLSYSVLEIGRRCITDAVNVLAKAWGAA